MQHLKLKLQQFGPVRPAAWAMIGLLCKETHLIANESFIREAGTIAFVKTGLLKEYDAQYRKTPAIINFIGPDGFLITRRHNQKHYLKACVPTVIYHWDFECLQNIYQHFPELKQIYDLLCGSYDASSSLRQLILEEKDGNQRIAQFVKMHQQLLPLLRKKEIANYLHLGYDYLIRNYNKHL